jgi:hypothetical protein
MVNVRSGQDLWDAYSSADSAHVEVRFIPSFVPHWRLKPAVLGRVPSNPLPVPYRARRPPVCCRARRQFPHLVRSLVPRLTTEMQEIEKTLDDKALWTLHMPWESGACDLALFRLCVNSYQVGTPLRQAGPMWTCDRSSGLPHRTSALSSCPTMTPVVWSPARR